MHTAYFFVRSFAAAMLALTPCRSAVGAPGTVVEWGAPVGVQAGATGFSKIAAGANHLIALAEAGQQAVWGGTAQSLQVPSSPFGGTLTQLAAGDGKSAGLWSTGRVTMTGFSFFDAWMDVTAIAMGGTQTVARFSGGTVAVDGGVFPPADLTDVTKVAAGPHHVLEHKTDGAVVAWGSTVRGVWFRLRNHAAAGLVYTPEFSANHSAFTAFTAAAAVPQVLASDANYDAVAVTFPASVPGGVPKFFRVRVSIPNPD